MIQQQGMEDRLKEKIGLILLSNPPHLIFRKFNNKVSG